MAGVPEAPENVQCAFGGRCVGRDAEGGVVVRGDQRGVEQRVLQADVLQTASKYFGHDAGDRVGEALGVRDVGGHRVLLLGFAPNRSAVEERVDENLRINKWRP